MTPLNHTNNTPTLRIALIREPFLHEILCGRKTIETRLSATKRAPYNRARQGERILFKQSSGPYRAAAVIAHAKHQRISSHDQLMQLFERHRDAIAGHAITAARQFFLQRTATRFATLLTITDVTPIATGPAIPRLHGRAWICVPDERAARQHHSRRPA